MRGMLVCTAACSVTVRPVSGPEESDCVQEASDTHSGVVASYSDIMAIAVSLVRIRGGVNWKT